ncbi:MAG: PH domain-containing protein [Candidatus Pacearchaeota archaeon]
MNKLHPGARWLFRLQAYYYLILHGILIIFFGIFIARLGFFISILFYISFIIIFGEIYSRMSYNRYLYEINNEYIKIEHGIIWKKYTSIPYEKVQNVDIKRGIIARMFGFSTVEIETAGQSEMDIEYYRSIFVRRGYTPYKSEGHLPAIDINDAEKIRKFIIKKIKKTDKKNSGL